MRGGEADFSAEARAIQRKAIEGLGSVVRFGPIVFFSTETGDAWMLDAENGQAACLVRDFEAARVPIRETEETFAVEWSATYAIEDGMFAVVESDGSSRSIAGYPTAEIRRLIAAGAGGAAESGHVQVSAAAERLKTGRNDLCPCGSGRKYKKCCLPQDQAIVREAAVAGASADIPALPRPIDLESQAADFEPEDTVPFSSASEEVHPVWQEFESLTEPTTGQMDRLLEKFLALPPEETDWPDLFREFARSGHGDLPGLFRRISNSVPHTKATELAFFYWAAAEEFEQRGFRDLLPEIASGFQRLDRDSYDPDALVHLEDCLLAAGFDASALRLCEHFLPILREGAAAGVLTPYALPRLCARIFDLRIGSALRGEFSTREPAPELARALRAGIEDEIHADSGTTAAAAILGESPRVTYTRDQFDLVTGDVSRDDGAWRQALALNAALIAVAREGWQSGQTALGSAVVGLQLMLASVYNSAARTGKRKRAGWNFISHLAPSGIEARIAAECREMIGVNVPRPRLHLDAYDILREVAVRHQLISSLAASQSEEEIARLRSQLEETDQSAQGPRN